MSAIFRTITALTVLLLVCRGSVRGQITDPSIVNWSINNTGATGTSVDTEIDDLVSLILADVEAVHYNNNFVFVEASGVPSYNVGPFRNNTYASDLDATFRIRRNPAADTSGNNQIALGGPIGVLVNGVVIFSYSDAQSYNNQGIWNQDATVFEAAGLGGLASEGAAYIYDIPNLGLGSMSLLGQIATGQNTASVAANSDHSQLIVSHRETGGMLATWDIADLSAAHEIESIDASDLDVNALSAGAIYVLDSAAYVAWHQAGVQVIDLDLLEQTETIFRIGAFGTSQASPLEGFVGNTSVFPIDHNKVLLADSRWGLYLVDATNVVTSFNLGDV